MFDFAWSELALIAAVALVVIGPKDLPRVLRTVGMWVGRARAVAREFQGSIDQMVREAELEEVRKQVQKATNFDVGNEIEKTIDPTGELKKTLAEPIVPDRPATAPPPAPATAVPAIEAQGKPASVEEQAPAKSDTPA